MLRFILLTATRRDEAANMRQSEISEVEPDIWTIPAARNKTNIDFELPLSRSAQDVLSGATKLGKKGFVFTTGGKTGIGGFSKFKKEFDGLMREALRNVAVERGSTHGSDDPAKGQLMRLRGLLDVSNGDQR